MVNRDEKQIGKYFVYSFAVIDGVEHVWEFQGCYYHGCPSCFEPSAICPLTGSPYEELYRATEENIQMLKSVYGV